MRNGLLLILLVMVLSACAKGPGTSYAPLETSSKVIEVSPTQVPTETPTATQVPTSTETATATENPAETANPFDRSTFPAEFQKDPATMTEQEQTDYQTFLNAARENFIKNQGIQDKVDQMKASGKLNNRFLDLMAMFYAQNNPDQLKNPELAKGKDVVVGPQEVRDALEQNGNNIIKLWYQPITDKGKWWEVEYGWYMAGGILANQEISIFGVNEKIQYSDGPISGVLEGISSSDNDPNNKVLWIIIKDSSNNLDLVPRLVNLAPDFTISGSKGAACRVGSEAFALYELPEDVPFGPPGDMHGKTWTIDSLYSSLGKPVSTSGISGPFQHWATSNNSKLFGEQCYVYGLSVDGSLTVTNPYFSPPIWEELTSAP